LPKYECFFFIEENGNNINSGYKYQAMQHKSKLPNVATNIFTIMGAMANKYNAINLSQGFPNFKSDQKLMDLVSNALNSGYNQYAPMPGIFSLREAISNKFELLYNQSYHPETEITVTAGATQAIYTIISTLIRPNDEVIIFKPAYDCLTIVMSQRLNLMEEKQFQYN